MGNIIVYDIGEDNSWAEVETKGKIFVVGLTHDEDGLSSVTFSPVELTEEDMNLIEDEVNVEPVGLRLLQNEEQLNNEQTLKGGVR